MKGRKLTLILVMLLVLVCSFALTACHEHTCETEWVYDNAGHWHEATCKHTGEKVGYEAHTVMPISAKPATCTSTGNNQYWLCATCGAAFKDEQMTTPTYDYAEITPILPHVYDQKVTNADTLVSAATCTSKAVYYYTCTCGAIGTDTFESGALVAHDLTLIPAVVANCLQTGNNEYYQCNDCEACFRDAQATIPTNPDAEALPITGHAPVYHAGEVATCTKEGKAEYWTCEVCDKMFEDAYCKYEITSIRVIPVAPHSYSNVAHEKYLINAATCEVVASYYESCTACGIQGKNTFEFGSLAAHKLTEIAAVAPTCSTTGNSRYYQCTVCEKYYTDLTAQTLTTPEENVLPIAAHVYDQKVVEGQYRASEATCLQQATYYYSCVCGHYDLQLSETFAAGSLGAHIPGMVVEAKAPVCETETDGNIAYCVCALEDCGKKFTTVEGKVVELSDEDIVVEWAHSWVEKVDNKYLKDHATCVQYESYYKSCKECGAQNDSETFVYGIYRPHTLGEIVAAKEVNCLENGHVEYSICTVCSQYIDKNAQVIGDGTAAAIVIATPNNGKHDYRALPAENLIYKEATCTSAALYHKTCYYCGIIDEETANEADRYFEYGDKLPHDYFDWVEAKDPTCLEDGNVKYRECKSCHQYFDENDGVISTYVIARTGHKEVQVAEANYLVSPATCTARARYYTSCESCHIALSATFEAGEFAPHSLTHYDPVPAACGVAGNIEYNECANCHNKFLADEVTRVDDIVVPALQHGWVSWVMENDENLKLAQSCTNAATYWQYCTRCGEISTELTFTVGQPAPHSLDWEGSFIAAVAPTCTAQGNVAYYECEHCHHFFAEDKETELTAEQLVREVVEHNWVEDTEKEIMVSPATCQVLAKYEKVCSICGKHASEYTLAGDEYYFSAGEYAEHNKQFHAEVPAQCEQDGTIAHYTCSYECGKFWNENEEEVTSIVITALTHNYVLQNTDNLQNRKSEATCTEAEVWFSQCEHCDGISEEHTFTYGPALGHDLEGVELVAYVAPTCTKPGNEAYKVCNRCECNIAEDGTTIIEDVVIAKLNHNFTKKLVEDSYKLSNADCENAAVYYFACANENCDELNAKSSEYTYTEGKALGHEYGEWIAAVPAGCTTIGTQAHFECSVCHKYFDGNKVQIGEVLADIQEPATDHSMTQDPAGLTDTYLKDKATCIAPAVYYEYCSVCKEKGTNTFSYGEVAVLCSKDTLTHYEAITEFDFDIDEFPANCQYEHWQCELCNKYYADALGDKQFTQNNGNPKYKLDRRTMAIGKMDGDKFDVNVLTTLSLATGYSYTIGGIVPYVQGNWGQEGLNDGNRVAIQFAAKYFVYGKTQAGVIARLTSGSYVKEFNAAQLQIGSVENNIEAGSLLAIFNLSPDTDIKLEVLAETGWITYTFKLATGIEMVQYVPAVEATYWNSGNKAYYTLGEGRYFEDGYATVQIPDLATHLLNQLTMTFEGVAGQHAQFVATGVAGAYRLEGAIISVAGVARYTLTIKENLADLFAHVAEDEVVLKVTIGSEVFNYNLTQFDFTADGYYTRDFDVVAGQTVRIDLRNPKVVDSYVSFAVTVADNFVTPSFEQGKPATFWADGINDNYILNEVRYVDVLCTQPLAEENYIQPKLVANFAVAQDATYSLVANVLSGIVAYNAEANAYIATILFDARLANYEGLVITINGQAVDVAKVLANGYDFAIAKDATLTIALTLGEATETYTITLDEQIKAPKLIETTQATLLSVGLEQHYKCAISGKYFADANCETEVDYESLVTAKLVPTIVAGRVDENNAFVVDGVSYAITLDQETGKYVLSGAIVGGMILPADQYRYGYIVRFVEDFATLYANAQNEEVIIRLTYNGGRVVEITKAQAFDAENKVLLNLDAYETVQISFYNAATTEWTDYEVVFAEEGLLNRIEVLADAQVGSFDAEGNFIVGRRLVYNAETGAFDTYQDLAYTVAVNDAKEYVITGLVPSEQDVNGNDTNKFNVTLKFNYNFKAIFANVSDDTVVMRYRATGVDGIIKEFTKAQLFANETALFFTADATLSNNYFCEIMNVDGQSVWMQYRIVIAEDVVCPVFNYETAPNYWDNGYKQHYSNARVEGKYYADYDCTQELNAQDVVIAKIYAEDMIAGSYVSDNNGGFKFATYEYIKYSFAETDTNVYTLNGSIPCYNDKSVEAEKALHKFVVKIKGNFQVNYNYYKDTDVIAKVYVNGEEMNAYTKAQMIFDADGSIVFVCQATKGATIQLDLLSPRYAEFGALVYTFNVSNDVILTHDLHYVTDVEPTYWATGSQYAECEDCGAEVALDGNASILPKLTATVETGSIVAGEEGNQYVTSESLTLVANGNTYNVNGTIYCGSDVRYPNDATRLVFKFVGNFAQYFASHATDAVIVRVGTTDITKADVIFDADGNLIVSANIEIGATVNISIANPVDGTFDVLVYTINNTNTPVYHPNTEEVNTPATYWAEGAVYTKCAVCDTPTTVPATTPKLEMPAIATGSIVLNGEAYEYVTSESLALEYDADLSRYYTVGMIYCGNDARYPNATKFVFKFVGNFAQYFVEYDVNSVAVKVGTTNITLADVMFDVDGNLIVSAVLNLEDIANICIANPVDGSLDMLVYKVYVDRNTTQSVHNGTYTEDSATGTYWQAGYSYKLCDACGSKYEYVETEKLAAPEVQTGAIAPDGEGYKYATNDQLTLVGSGNTYNTQGTIYCGNDARHTNETRLVFKFVGNIAQYFASHAQDAVIVRVGTTNITKADVIFDADGNLIVSSVITSDTTVITISIATPENGVGEEVVYTINVSAGTTFDHYEIVTGGSPATFWEAGSTYQMCSACGAQLSQPEGGGSAVLPLPNIEIGSVDYNADGDLVWKSDYDFYTLTEQSTDGQYKFNGDLPCSSDEFIAYKNYMPIIRVQGNFASYYANMPADTVVIRAYKTTSAKTTVQTGFTTNQLDITLSQITFDEDGSMIFALKDAGSSSIYNSQSRYLNYHVRIRIANPKDTTEYMANDLYIWFTKKPTMQHQYTPEPVKTSEQTYWSDEYWYTLCTVCGSKGTLDSSKTKTALVPTIKNANGEEIILNNKQGTISESDLPLTLTFDLSVYDDTWTDDMIFLSIGESAIKGDHYTFGQLRAGNGTITITTLPTVTGSTTPGIKFYATIGIPNESGTITWPSSKVFATITVK